MGDLGHSDSSMFNPFGDAFEDGFDSENIDWNYFAVDYSNSNNSRVFINNGTYSKFLCLVPDHRSLN
jgi:hypothetical protein